jgi:hypothetical protein
MKRVVFAFLFLCAAVFALAADDFWSARELSDDGFSELDGVIKLRFKDAVSAEPISGLQITTGTGTLKAGADGVIDLPVDQIKDIVDKDIPFVASAPGYIPLKDALRIRVGTLITTRFTMSKEIKVNQARMVVEWDQKPLDVDAWLVGPDFTVSYRSMKNAEGNATLDRDARRGFGPETITLNNLRQDAKYLFSIQNYSRESALKNVKVTFYLNNQLARVIWIASSSQDKVDILRIVNGSSEFLLP